MQVHPASCVFTNMHPIPPCIECPFTVTYELDPSCVQIRIVPSGREPAFNVMVAIPVEWNSTREQIGVYDPVETVGLSRSAMPKDAVAFPAVPSVSVLPGAVVPMPTLPAAVRTKLVKPGPTS